MAWTWVLDDIIELRPYLELAQPLELVLRDNMLYLSEPVWIVSSVTCSQKHSQKLFIISVMNIFKCLVAICISFMNAYWWY